MNAIVKGRRWSSKTASVCNIKGDKFVVCVGSKYVRNRKGFTTLLDASRTIRKEACRTFQGVYRITYSNIIKEYREPLLKSGPWFRELPLKSGTRFCI